jgi:hypothetical protein
MVPSTLSTTSKILTPLASAGLPGSTSVTRFREPLIVMPNGRSAAARRSLRATLLTAIGVSDRKASPDDNRLETGCLPRALEDRPSDSSTPPWLDSARLSPSPSPSRSSRLVLSEQKHLVRRQRIDQPRRPRARRRDSTGVPAPSCAGEITHQRGPEGLHACRPASPRQRKAPS